MHSCCCCNQHQQPQLLHAFVHLRRLRLAAPLAATPSLPSRPRWCSGTFCPAAPTVRHCGSSTEATRATASACWTCRQRCAHVSLWSRSSLPARIIAAAAECITCKLQLTCEEAAACIVACEPERTHACVLSSRLQVMHVIELEMPPSGSLAPGASATLRITFTPQVRACAAAPLLLLLLR